MRHESDSRFWIHKFQIQYGTWTRPTTIYASSTGLALLISADQESIELIAKEMLPEKAQATDVPKERCRKRRTMQETMQRPACSGRCGDRKGCRGRGRGAYGECCEEQCRKSAPRDPLDNGINSNRALSTSTLTLSLRWPEKQARLICLRSGKWAFSFDRERDSERHSALHGTIVYAEPRAAQGAVQAAVYAAVYAAAIHAARHCNFRPSSSVPAKR